MPKNTWKTQNKMLDWNTQKTKVAYGKENHYLARKKMESKSIRLASWIGH